MRLLSNLRAVTALARPLPGGLTPSSALAGPRLVRFFAGKVVDIVVPSMGDSISEGRIIDWSRKENQACAADDILVQLETDKVTVDVRAPAAGVVTSMLSRAGDTVAVGQVIGKFEIGAAASAEAPKAEAAAAAAAKPAAAPAAAAAPAKPAPVKPAAAPAAAAAAPAPAAAQSSDELRERRVPMTKMRIRIAQRLKESQNTAAMLTTFNEVDMSAVMKMRNDFKDEFEKKHGVKLGFMSAFVSAACIALKAVPAVNAVIDGDDIVYRDYCDVSVAVANPKGLVVPVIRNADAMSWADIEKEIVRLSEKARSGSLTIADMQGGTFSISNGGIFGSLMGTPIINPPQSAILGMHAIKNRPVAVGNEVAVRPMMYLALTYDHRLIDGREAVTFLKTVKEIVEDPRRIVLGL